LRKIGILGVGFIGQTLAAAIDERRIPAELVALSDLDHAKAEAVARRLASHPRVVPLEQLIESSDLIVEAASQRALPDLIPNALERARDLLIMSVGGLLGHREWFDRASEKGCRIYVPSGAIAGLDGIKAASMGRVDSALLTSRKPVATLKASPYVVSRGIKIHQWKKETLLFEGSAEEAAQAFPSTANVAAALRLAIDPSVPVRVRIMAVPMGRHNVHEILVTGGFGRLSVAVENVPSASNPRTSQLAALSAIATLTNLTRTLHVGT